MLPSSASLIQHPVPGDPTAFRSALTSRVRWRFLGLDLQGWIKFFFRGNATIAIIILLLIMVFLFREGAGFFPQHDRNLTLYRQTGLEFVDNLIRQVDAHTALGRDLSKLKLAQQTWLTEEQGLEFAEAGERLAPWSDAYRTFKDAIKPIRSLQNNLRDAASSLKQKAVVSGYREDEREMLLEAGRQAESKAVAVEELDFAAETQLFSDSLADYDNLIPEFEQTLRSVAENLPGPVAPGAAKLQEKFETDLEGFIAAIPETRRAMAEWRHDKPVSPFKSVTAFILGKDWVTNSYWHDFYGVLPLLLGSFYISFLALVLAVPFGVGAAIYTNQIAGQKQQRIIKPWIEFIGAIPSVVLGFFGVVVLGELLRQLSQASWLSWVPGFPMIERLNIFTAGCLLALMAIPTIFTLAEDAINNVPRHFRDASFALGANRLQTITSIIVPASLSGIIAAVLLGFGRVIGETMVVLLVAGNKIAIPDITEGLGMFFQPAHTMTGIIAQEMGEVVPGSIHYRALFVVGILLFVISLVLNAAAQRIVHKYKIGIG